MAFKHTTVERFPGVRIILLLIPTKYQVEAAYREEVCEGFHICEAGDIHRSINLVRGAATRLDLEILDMQPILSNAGEKKDWFYYRHNDHWTKDAHELAGIELSRMIERGE